MFLGLDSRPDSLCSVAVKRQHGHSNSYKGKHFIGADLQVSRFSSLSVWQVARSEEWCHTGRHGAREATEFYICICRQQEKGTLVLAWGFENPKATSSDTLPPRRPHLLIPVKLHHSLDPAFKYLRLWPLLLKSPHTELHLQLPVTSLLFSLISVLHTEGNMGLLVSAHFTVL